MIKHRYRNDRGGIIDSSLPEFYFIGWFQHVRKLGKVSCLPPSPSLFSEGCCKKVAFQELQMPDETLDLPAMGVMVLVSRSITPFGATAGRP